MVSRLNRLVEGLEKHGGTPLLLHSLRFFLPTAARMRGWIVSFVFLAATVAARAQSVPERDSIVVGINSDYPPYEFQDNKGNPSGFDTDVIRAAAKAVYLNVTLKAGKWDDIKRDLENKRIDALAGMLFSAERSKTFSFSEPYLDVEYSMFVRAGSKVGSLDDLAAKTVLVEQGSQMHEQLRHLKIGAIEPVSSEPEGLRQLAKGKGDVALLPLLEGLVLIRDEGLTGVKAVGGPLYSRNLCFSTYKGNRQLINRLNTGLAIIRKDGTYDQIYDKWFSEAMSAKWMLYVRYLLWTLAFTAIIFVVGTIWVFTLRRTVAQRTEALNQELAERMRVQRELAVGEEMYRNLVENASDGILTIDEHGLLASANAAFSAMLGYELGELVNRPIQELLRADEIGSTPTPYDELKSDQSSLSEWVFKRKDGTQVETEISASKVGPGKYQAIVRDISLRKETERRLLDLNEELERRVQVRTAELRVAYDELETFSYSVSHDLRGPLRAMSGFANIVLEDHGDELSEEAKGQLGRISTNAEIMSKLIDDLLRYAKMGRAPLRCEEIDLRDLAGQVWESLHAENSSGIRLELGALPHVWADPTLIRLVVANLFDNAIKFSRGSSAGTVEFGYDANQSAFYVKDHGVGFEPQYGHKLFGVFERLHTSEFEGTGVGLAIVKRIIERHGGRVWAEGVPNVGATFWFTVDLAEEQKVSAHA